MFGLLRQGDGKIIITASFEDKMQTIRLPHIESVDGAWEFLEILFEELRCECFYEKEANENSSSASNVMPSGVKRRKISTSEESESTESSEDEPKPVMTTLSFNPTSSSDSPPPPTLKAMRMSQDQDKVTPKAATKPRGRPPGAKNKTPASETTKSQKTKSKSNKIPPAPQAPPTSPSKRLPIYHNAHKLYQAQQAAKQQEFVTAMAVTGGPPALLPQVPITTQTSSHLINPITRHPNPMYVAPAFSLPSVPLPIQPPPPPVVNPVAVAVAPADPSEWSIEDVVSQVSQLDPTLGLHVEMFRTHEIDGKALLLLTEDMMMKYMDMKLGPALKISNIVNMIQGKKHQPIPKF